MKTKTEKRALKPEDAAAVKKAAKVLARLSRRAQRWSDRIDGMAGRWSGKAGGACKAEWKKEIEKFHEWARAVEKETGTKLLACEFKMELGL